MAEGAGFRWLRGRGLMAEGAGTSSFPWCSNRASQIAERVGVQSGPKDACWRSFHL